MWILRALHQIVLNLAINAAQASSTGGIVEICADRDTAHSVTITVADRGAGIPLEIQGRIFDPFFTTKQKDRVWGWRSWRRMCVTSAVTSVWTAPSMAMWELRLR